LAHLAATVAGGGAARTRVALWICFGVALGGALAALALYALGGVRPPSPDVERWMDGDEPAWDSPPLLAAVRKGTPEPALVEHMAAGLSDHHGDGARRPRV